MDLLAEEDDPLQAALTTAFMDPPIITPHPEGPRHISQETVPEAAPAEAEYDDAWKGEYDHLLAGWRAESSIAREKAENERERWRIIREQEEQKGNVHEMHSEPPERNDGVPPSPAEVRDLVTGETPHKQSSKRTESLSLRPEPHSTEYIIPERHQQQPSAPQSNTDDPGLSGSRTWEEVPSLESSFPSLSFPDRSANVSPGSRQRPSYLQPPEAPSVSFAIFDSSLSRRARILALASSLAINVFLPFVNGVMLGFGEIFAKHIIGYFGWNIPGSTVGIRAAPRRK